MWCIKNQKLLFGIRRVFRYLEYRHANVIGESSTIGGRLCGSYMQNTRDLGTC